MDAWLALDAEMRTAWVALAGLLLGVIVNWSVSSLAYEPRLTSPWSRRHPRDGRSVWLDRLPVLGWILLRRKAPSLGRGFWIRPLFVELGLAAALAALYAWEVLDGGLLPTGVPRQMLHNPMIAYPLHFTFVAHALLLGFMAASSLIDFDELNIPDAITVPGTLVGLVFTTVFPWAFLPTVDMRGQLGIVFSIYPHDHAIPLQNSPNYYSLAVLCGCFWLWCGGLLHRPWRTRHGYRRALQLMFARMLRDRTTPRIALLAVVGTACITAVWLYAPVPWIGLGTSLIGLAVGGAMVWATRVIGTWALGMEAMGFGDVTLLAMIGSFVGWQAAVLVFFAAPGIALVFGSLQWVITRNNAFCYGPFLCIATAAIVVGWSPIWEWAEPRFSAGWLIPGVLVVGFVMLWAVLAGLRWLRTRGE